MDYRIISVLSANEPITLAEAKNYIRITNTQDDTLITSMITQGRQMAEAYLSKDVLSKRREVYIPFADQEFYLPFSPIDQSVALEIEVDGVAITTDDYTTFGYENPSIRLNRGSRDIKITYTTKGLGDEVKQGILAATAFLYKAAGRGNVMEFKNIMTDYRTFLAPYKRLYI